jgi:hypothetical protein
MEAVAPSAAGSDVGAQTACRTHVVDAALMEVPQAEPVRRRAAAHLS